MRLVPSGNCDIQSVYDLRGAVSYVTKQSLQIDNYEAFFLSTEFHSG